MNAQSESHEPLLCAVIPYCDELHCASAQAHFPAEQLTSVSGPQGRFSISVVDPIAHTACCTCVHSCAGREDAALAAGLAPAAARALHGELASGAESGWDFSSRWCTLPYSCTSFNQALLSLGMELSVSSCNQTTLMTWPLHEV